MPENYLLPLELLLREKSMEIPELPHPRMELFERYREIVRHLREEVYPLIDAGLAGLSEDQGLYTLHGADHFDEVVRYAGELQGCKTGQEQPRLSAYELFVLLVAIRIHDAGNMFGREGHERRAFQILREMGDAAGNDDFEKRIIADIAEAHGGRTPGGSRDTIGHLRSTGEKYYSAKIRSRLLAAIVRFADEICESQSRAARKLLAANAIPKHNEAFHKYAECIKSVTIEDGFVSLDYHFSVQDALRKWGKGKSPSDVEEVFLQDEILARLDKMMLERQYCARFMRDVCDVRGIKVAIEIHDENFQRVLDDISLTSEDEGYPELASCLHERYSGYTGAELYRKLTAESAQERR